tara:strand:- start:336 stop:827 length:492 start_codon:yes stop_codon:yes gene_type:complete
MNNLKALNFINYKSICNAVAIFGGIFAVVSALAPDTLSQLFNISSNSPESANWVSGSRTTWITVGSLALLASWGRFIDEVYAQKVLMKFFSVFFGAFAISNALNGIESGAVIHSVSIASIAGLSVISWLCWANGRGVEPNTKKLSSNQTISVLPSEEEKKVTG